MVEKVESDPRSETHSGLMVHFGARPGTEGRKADEHCAVGATSGCGRREHRPNKVHVPRRIQDDRISAVPRETCATECDGQRATGHTIEGDQALGDRVVLS